jgi:hypothetical protein
MEDFVLRNYHSLLQREHLCTAAFLQAAQVGCSINSCTPMHISSFKEKRGVLILVRQARTEHFLLEL